MFNDFPKRLKHYRSVFGMSQAALAAKIEYSQQQVAKWEVGNSVPDVKTLKRLAELFETTIDDLLGNNVAPSTSHIINEKTTYNIKISPDKNAPIYSERKITDLKLDAASLSNYIGTLNETRRIPIIGTVKCGPDGLAYQLAEGYVLVGDDCKGDIIAFHCRGDSMKDVGISEGDIAVVRLQEDVENGEIAVVVIDNEEGTLKRVRKFEGGVILEAANSIYPPRVFTEKEKHTLHIVGKVLEVRKKF